MHEVDTVTWGVGATAGILAGAAVIIPILVKAFKLHIAPRCVSKAALLQLMKETSIEVKRLSTELKPNGGSTIRDLLDRIERNQTVQGEKQRAVFTTLPIGIFEADVQGNVTWANRKLCRMTGRTPNELKGSGWINALKYEDRTRVRANWINSIASQSEYEERATLTTPDAVNTHAFIQSMKLENADGGAIGYVVTVTNIEDPAGVAE
jgi:PAS domain S-box-containing protein